MSEQTVSEQTVVEGKVLSWDDIDERPTPPTPAALPAQAEAPKPRGKPWGEYLSEVLDRIGEMLPSVARILELAPAAVEGGRVKLWMTRNAAQQAGAAPNATNGDTGPIPNEDQAFKALYSLALYVAGLAPTITVGGALERAEALAGQPLTPIREAAQRAGILTTRLADALIFAVPLRRPQIMAALAQIATLEAPAPSPEARGGE